MKTLLCQWKNLKRHKLYSLLCFVLYFVFALFDFKNSTHLNTMEDQIYRHNFQQWVMVFAHVIITLMVLNEQFFEVYENLLKLYLKNEKRFFYAVLAMLGAACLIPFVLGQVVLLGYSHLMGDFIDYKLWLVNLCIVSCETVITICLSAGLILYLRKNTLVYTAYYLIVFSLLVINNIYVSIPLSMSLLESEGYYLSFAQPLWTGRALLITLSLAFVLRAITTVSAPREKPEKQVAHESL